MKKFIPLGTALLSLLAIIGIFFKYVKVSGAFFGFGTEGGEIAFLGDNSIMKADDLVFDFLNTSKIFYIIALVLLVIVIAIAVLNFLGIGGKTVGYAFIGVSALAFIAALIAMIMLFKTETVAVFEVKFTPALGSWWTTGAAFLAMLSTANVLLNKKRK